ncbi:Aromatic-ring hydroxylase-like protein [Niveomyces insectorum RCEF 264]|uniref:Aromatic-ring hydroxylase-like protein n=1 Tax=Niveomyces insectorum RCEF 264 TaxID=1081102 RepID=A0A162ICV9_9HYPO|nr:Aromatic-ring hydroxylase-like protein [Niveomyces insectorum RCEF 264]
MASPFDLHIAIVGAGMGGLGCALSLAKKGFQRIDVYEAAADLGFVGAGIQMAPNMARILDRLGCWAGIEKEATKVKETSVREGSADTELVHVDMGNVRDLYGYPHCTGHRSSLAGGLYRACCAEPAVHFHFSTALVGVDRFEPRPVLRLQTRTKGGAKPGDGDGGSGHGDETAAPVFTVEVDVLLGADGIKSATRTALLAAAPGGPYTTEEADTGQASYRIMLTRDQLVAAHDTELLALLDSDCVVRWIGPRRHLIAYPVAGKTVYNISTAQPDVHFAAAPSATYTTRGSKSAMLGVFADFCPRVQRMLALVPADEVCEWRLRQHRELPTWVHGAVALLGDACHPTLPHLSQGAAMAIEDGAVLAAVLARSVPDGPHGNAATLLPPAELYRRLKTYELLRKKRTSLLVDMAAHAGRVLHLGEGEARAERDRQFAAHKQDGTTAVPDKWASPDVQAMIYAHDCVADAAARFDELYATVGPEAEA